MPDIPFDVVVIVAGAGLLLMLVAAFFLKTENPAETHVNRNRAK